MRRYLFFFLLLFYVSLTHAQKINKFGIQFFNGTWQQLLDEAKKQKKIIFVDVYTDWCVPCKYMDQRIFTQKQVGEQYNKWFINYRLNPEKGEGIQLNKKLGVHVFPSFLFLNSEGYLIHKVAGELETEPFIALSREAIKQNADANNLGNLKKTYEAGNRKPQFLKNYLVRLKAADMENSRELDAYLSTQSPASLKEDSTLIFFAQHLNGKKSKALTYVVDHYAQLDDQQKAELTKRLFFKLISMEAGLAMKEKREADYNYLMNFGRRLYKLSEDNINVLNRLDLMQGVAAKDHDLIKKAGYAMASKRMLIRTDTIKARDKQLFDETMRPYYTGEKDSTKILGFKEEKNIS